MDVVEKKHLTWYQVEGLVDELAIKVKSEFANKRERSSIEI